MTLVDQKFDLLKNDENQPEFLIKPVEQSSKQPRSSIQAPVSEEVDLTILQI
jgi:hypothetical protein